MERREGREDCASAACGDLFISLYTRVALLFLVDPVFTSGKGAAVTAGSQALGSIEGDNVVENNEEKLHAKMKGSHAL